MKLRSVLVAALLLAPTAALAAPGIVTMTLSPPGASVAMLLIDRLVRCCDVCNTSGPLTIMATDVLFAPTSLRRVAPPETVIVFASAPRPVPRRQPKVGAVAGHAAARPAGTGLRLRILPIAGGPARRVLVPLPRRLAGGRPEPGEVADRPDDVGGPTDHLQNGLNIVREVEERDDQRRGGGHYERHEIDERGVDNERNDPRGKARIVSARALAHWAGRSRT